MAEHYATGDPVGTPLPALQPSVELLGGPSRLMRVLLALREMVLIVWLACGIILMVLLLATIGRVAHAVSDATEPDPAPAVTGCPFGEDECGG